jgi:hypothetical protein
MDRQSKDPNRMMGCLFVLIAIVFLSISALAGVTAVLAQGHAEVEEQLVRQLWSRCIGSGLLGVVTVFAAYFVSRAGR